MEGQGDQADQAAAQLPSGSIKKKHEERHRKKDPKSWDNIVKATATMDEGAKMAYIQEKYNEVYNDMRKISISWQLCVKQNASFKKDADHNQSEMMKGVMARSRLENLCRELQKQNKMIKEENLNRIKEEEERRKEISVKFAEKLTDINTMMDESKDKSEKLREENIKMTNKLSELYNQFQQREDDVAKMAQQLELERKYAQATQAKIKLEFKAEKERFLQVKTMLEAHLDATEAKCTSYQDEIQSLQEHIHKYKSQYEDFESAMTKSTQVFDRFKSEMSIMSKKMTALESEKLSWRSKWDQSVKAILHLSEDKKNQEAIIQASEKKIDQLQKLCRQLQVDRSFFLQLLKTNGINPTPMASAANVEAPPEASQTQAEAAKAMTKKEKELSFLKDNLKGLQEALFKITIDQDKTDVTQSFTTTTPSLTITNSNTPITTLAPISSPLRCETDDVVPIPESSQSGEGEAIIVDNGISGPSQPNKETAAPGSEEVVVQTVDANQ